MGIFEAEINLRNGTIALLVIGVVAFGFIAYVSSDPIGLAILFHLRPNVRFFESPSISENNVMVHHSTIITVTARNQDNTPVHNVVAVLSVVKGANAEQHLEFSKTIPLADEITPGNVSDTKHISITAKDISGESTPFGMLLQLEVDGVVTQEYPFDLTIVPET